MNRLGSVSALCLALACGHTPPPTPGPGTPPEIFEAATPAAPIPTTTVATGTAPTALVATGGGRVLLAEDGPPISLTAADGTGLVLTRLEAKAVVEGPLAYTELRLSFQNPLDRVLEGRFAITLPDGAALSRFAMKMESGWMEAEVVERQAARRAYEDFLHRKQDPALLENEGGNQFSARVFPIPARGEKQLIVSFSHEVHGNYTLPLRGLPEIGSVSAQVQVARPDRTGAAYDQTVFGEEKWTPDRDVVVALDAAPRAIRAGDLIAVSIDPLASATPVPIDGMTILFDTSASRALGYAAQVDALIATVGALAQTHGAALPITIAAFDQQVVEVYRGPAHGVAAVKAALLARTALGASDLAGALRWAAGQGGKRVVVIGDAVPTLGDDDALTASLAALGRKSERLDVVLIGGIRDRATAARLTHGALQQDGAIIDGARGPTEVARRLGLATRSGLAVQVAGARWTWPAVLDGVQPGDATVVIAQLDGKVKPGAAVQVKAGDTTIDVTPTAVPAPLLGRAAAGAEIARLGAERAAATTPAARAQLADRIVKLSTRHRVMSDLTAFLVLETEADYARFEIPRTALADILTVGAKGLAVEHRANVVLLADDPAAVRPKTGDQHDGKPKPKKAAAPGGDVTSGFEDADAHGALDEGEEEAAKQADADGDADGGESFNGASDIEGMCGENSRCMSAARPPADSPRPAAPAPRPEPVAREQRLERTRGAMMDNLGSSSGTSGALSLRRVDPSEPSPPPPEDKPAGPTPLEGDMAIVMKQLAAGQLDDAMATARAWRQRDAGDVLALIALGEAAEAKQLPDLAARAYGSIIDLFPARADLRRFAGERLARVGAAGRAVAIDALRTAVEQRPDHLTGHRLLAWELVRHGDLPGAFAAIEHGLAQQYPADRFKGGVRILKEDLGIIATAWIAKAPGERGAIEKRLAAARGELATDPTLRFVLTWETDANDVDFHIRDARGNHAYYSQKSLASGGELYEDVTTGYGPECFTIRGKPAAGPYALQIHYYSRGPMGYGMGLLEIVRHDGKGQLAFEHRPYVVMADGAYVDLGTVDDKTASLGRAGASATIAR